jgi:hypothetical protein
MANQKLIILVGSICVLVIIVGIMSTNYFTGSTNTSNDIPTDSSTDTPTDTSTYTNEPSSSTDDNPSNTNESESLENNIGYLEDDAWETSNVTNITLSMDSITVDNQEGTVIDRTKITITSAGTYSISGTLNDGQVIVNTSDDKIVRLFLNGVTISSTSNSPLYIENADQTVIILADGTENYLTDTTRNTDNATLLSKDDLTIYGNGALTVHGNANDGIRSNDGLVIGNGTITVTSVDDGIRGKDYLIIKGGEITVNSGGDGLKSDNDEEPDKGNISIEAGTITVTATKGDAIAAQNNLSITDGTFTLTSGGGGNAMHNESISTKGLKAGINIVIDGGTFAINSLDDAIHSNDMITINDGTFNISSGDDGIHADLFLEINSGIFDITKSFEGMESEIININNGFIQIVSSDDGINLVEATESSSTNFGGGPGGFGGPGPGGETPSENCILYVNSGFIAIDSGGDGIDSNGYIEMSNGVLIINGPLSNMNAAIDYGGGSFTLTGGTLVAVGSAGMAQAPSASSTQYSANLGFSSAQSANVLVHIQTASGEDVLTFCPTKTYQSLVFSSPELVAGTYYVYVGGSSTGSSTNGLYEDGTYSGGTNLGSFTVS